MPLSTRDFAQLTDELQSIYAEHSANAIANAVGLQVFDVMETELKTFEHQILHGVAGIENLPEGADLPRVNGNEGDNISYTQSRYGAIVPITKDMRIFDLYAKMEGVVRSVVDDAWDKIDQSLADVLLLGWDTSFIDVYNKTVTSVCPDAAALFASTHDYGGASASTFTNIITDGSNTNPALSRTAILSQINAGMKYTDANGLLRPFKLDTVLVGPDLADLAFRIVDNDRLHDSSNWDKNKYVSGRIKEVKIWERLAQTGQGTATTAYWFMLATQNVGESLKCLFKQRPSMESPEAVSENKDWEYPIDYYYTIGRGFPPYVRGSKGDNS